MHLFYGVILIATLATAAPEYRDRLNLGDFEEISFDQKQDIPNTPDGETPSFNPDVASSAVFETYPAHKADAPLDSYSIAGTFNLEEQNPDIILSKPQPGMTWSLVDTTKCREVEGNCIPDQRLFNVIHDKREGISCDANELGELSKCKKCNAKKQCAWMSWKCPTEAETPAIDVQDKDLRNCQLCVEFWQSKYRCSNVLAETPWRYTSDSKYQRPQMKDFRLPNIDNL